MAGIQGLGGIPEPIPDRSVTSRDRQKDDTPSAGAQDEVLITSEAQAAAQLQKLVSAATLQGDSVRTDRVDQAKAAIEQGNYKRPEVVAEVAKRISNFLG